MEVVVLAMAKATEVERHVMACTRVCVVGKGHELQRGEERGQKYDCEIKSTFQKDIFQQSIFYKFFNNISKPSSV